MRSLGYGLVVLGFIGAALAAVWHPDQVPWPAYAGTLAAGIVGVTLLQAARRAVRGPAEAQHGTVRALSEGLARLEEGIAALQEALTADETLAVHAEIDHRLRPDLDAFADARHCLAHAHGLQAYADVMSSFAAGERYLNRVWSASADGYIDEVRQYLERARAQIADSRARIETLRLST